MKSVSTIFVYCVTIVVVFGQPKDSKSHVISERLTQNGKPASIPDPDNRFSIATLAANPSVARELALVPEVLTTLKKTLHASRGHLFGGVLEFSGPSFPAPAEIAAAHATIAVKNEAVLEELLTPSQWSRLRQITFQIEVSRVGLGNAITNGVLSKEVGVHDNQKAAILLKAKQIEEKAARAIAEVLSAAQNELLAELSPEQREKAKLALGSAFQYVDDSFQMFDPNRYKNE